MLYVVGMSSALFIDTPLCFLATIINLGGNIMEEFGNIIHVVGPEGKPEFNFIDVDEDYIKLINIDEPKQFVILNKQSLLAFANAFKSLAQRYTV